MCHRSAALFKYWQLNRAVNSLEQQVFLLVFAIELSHLTLNKILKCWFDFDTERQNWPSFICNQLSLARVKADD